MTRDASTDGSERVPFCRPHLSPRTLSEVAGAIESGSFLAADGTFSGRAERALRTLIDAEQLLLTASCTAALEACALLLDLSPGDEVILPSFTHPSTANPFVRHGAVPVFVDIRADTCNLDEELVEASVSERTRALVVTHYGGVACEMNALTDIAARHSLALIEDAALAFQARYRGRPTGSFGQLATLSFHRTKEITCGQGGALLVNDRELADRAVEVVDYGTDQRAFRDGLAEAYTWQRPGSNLRMPELSAAVLLPQLEEADSRLYSRRALWQRYQDELASWARGAAVETPAVPPDCRQNGHLFYLRAPNHSTRDAILAHLDRQGIEAAFHYQPLHLSRAAHRWRYGPGDLPVTEEVSATLLRLPLYEGLSRRAQDRVIEAVRSFPS